LSGHADGLSTEVSALGAIIAVMADGIHSASAPFDGRWWIPDDPDRVVGGRLSLIGEVWDLTLMGWLGPWDPNERPHSQPAIVYGEIGTTPVTLLEVVSGGWKAKTSPEAPYTSSVRVNRIILGAHTDGEALYKAAGVRLLHLNEWANRRKFTTETGEGFSSDTVVYAQPPTLEAELPGAKASLWSQWSQSHDLMLSYVSMTANEWVLFDFETPLSLAMIEHDYATPLANLLELVSNRPTAFFEFTVTPEGAGEGDQPWSVLSNEARGPVPSPRNPFELIFTLRDVDFDTVLPRWWRMQPDLGVVPGLLSSLRGRSSVANHFLNAASAIESYHRHLIRDVPPSAEHKALLKRIRDALARADWTWLKQFLIHSHEPSFAQRIDAVVARSGTLFPEDPQK
jgi:hypothetical protein